MFVAILLACSIAVPADCREHEMLLEARMPTQAWVEASNKAAEWLSEHQGLRSKSLKVVVGRGA